MSDFRLSVAVPLFNEEDVFQELHHRIGAVLAELPGGPHEIVFVDDGSTDRTRDLLHQAVEADPRVVAVLLSRNFGHQAALTAALDHVSGDATVIMDGDLQDVPELIPEFVQQWQAGYDVVYARRIDRKESAWLRLCYFVFYRVAAGLSDISLPLDVGDFGLISRRVVLLLRSMPEKKRYLRGLRAWAGFQQIGLAVERAPRAAGKTKYSLRRLINLALDGIFSFSVAPLRAAALMGLAAIVLSTLFAAYSVFAKLFLARSPQGFTALITSLTFLSGVQLFFLGLIGEYIGRIYEEIKARPVYVVGETLRSGTHIPIVETTSSVSEVERAVRTSWATRKA